MLLMLRLDRKYYASKGARTVRYFENKNCIFKFRKKISTATNILTTLRPAAQISNKSKKANQ